MKKQVKKWLTLAMAFALILGSINYNPLAANATVASVIEAEDSVTGNDVGGDAPDDVEGVVEDIDTVSGDMVSGLDKAQMFSMMRNVRLALGTYAFTSDDTGFKETSTNSSDYTSSIDSDGKISITYAVKGYPAAIFDFPSEVDLNKIKNIKLNVSSGDTSKVILKLLDAGGNEIKPYYNGDATANKVDIPLYFTGMEGQKKIAITYAGTPDENTVVVVDSIELECYDEKYCNKAYAIGELSLQSGSNYYSAETNVFSFDAQYNETKFNFPKYVADNSSYLRNVHFNIESNSASEVGYKIYRTGFSEALCLNGNSWAGAFSSAQSADHAVASAEANGLAGIGIMNNSDGKMELKVKDVTYTFVDDGSLVEEPAGTYTVTVYASKLQSAWSNATSAGLDIDNRYKIVLPGEQYKEACVNLPAKIDLGECESITFNVKNQTCPVNFCVGSSGTKQGTWYNNNGNTTYVLDPKELKDGSNANNVNYTGEIDQINVQIYSWPVQEGGGEIALESIVFTMKKTAGQEDQEFGADKKPIEEPTEIYSITVYASALKHDWSKAGITNTLGTDNRLKIDFGVDSQDSRYDLTDGNGKALSIDLANVEKVTFNVCDQEGRHNISLSNDGNKVGDPIQNQTGSASFEMVPTTKTGTINEVVFQAAGWDYTAGNTLTIESVVFTMTKTADDQEDVAYGVEPTEIEQDFTTNITPEAVSENDKRFTVKAGELEPQASNTVTCEAKDIEKAALTFVGDDDGVAWSEIRFELPEEINLANAKSVTFAVSDQSVPLSYKLYDANGEIKDLTVYSKTGKTNVITFAGKTEKVKSVGIMIHGDDVSKASTYTCLFDGVLFTMNAEDLETHTISFAADELVLGEKNIASCEILDGKYIMSFAALNQEATFRLPKTMNMENCVSVQITVSEQTGPVNYYLQLDGTKPEAHYYNTANATGIHTLASKLTTGVNEIRIQCGGEGAQGQEYVPDSGIVLEKITFTMIGSDETNDYLEEEEPDIEVVPGTDNITPAGDGKDDISYQSGTLKLAGATSAEYTKTDTDQYLLKFAKQYDEFKLNLTVPVDLLQCTDMTFAVSDQSCPLAFKLYMEDGSTVSKYDNDGQTLYPFAISRTGKVVAIGVMMNEKDLKDQTCVFDGVCFTMDTSLSTVTEVVEFPCVPVDFRKDTECSL